MQDRKNNPVNPRVYIEQPSNVTVNQRRDLLDRSIDAIQSGSTAVIFFCALVGLSSRGIVKKMFDRFSEIAERQVCSLEKLTKVSEEAEQHFQETREIKNTLLSIKLGIDNANDKLNRLD